MNFSKYGQLLCFLLLTFGCEESFADGVSTVEFNEWPFESRQALAGSHKSIRTMHSVAPDSSGRVWAGGAEGLFLFAGGDPHRIELGGDGDPEPILDLAESPDKSKMWFLKPRGAGWVDTVTGESRYIPDSGLDPDASLYHVFSFDGHGRLWIAARDGLYRFDDETGKYQQVESGEDYRHIEQIVPTPGCPGEIWLSAGPFGLIRYGENSIEHFQHAPEFQASYESGDGVNSVTFSPDEKKIHFVGGNAVSTLELESNLIETKRISVDWSTRYLDMTAVVYEETRGGLWIGSKHSSGFHFFDFATQTFRDLGERVRLDSTRMGLGVEDIFVDSERVIWMATENDGLVMNSIPSFEVDVYADWNDGGSGLYHGTCQSLFTLPSGALIHTTKGICRIDFEKNRSHAMTGNPKKDADPIMGVSLLEDGTLLAAHLGGLWRYKGDVYSDEVSQGWELVTELPGSEGKKYTRLAPHLDSDGLLWICLRNQLCSYDFETGEFKIWHEIRHWADAMTLTDGNLWIATEHHVYRWNTKTRKMDLTLGTTLQNTWDLIPNQNGTGIYLATSGGLYSINVDETRLTLLGYEDSVVKSICFGSSERHLWVVQKDSILSLFDLESKMEVRYPGETEFNIRKREFIRVEYDGQDGLQLCGWARFFRVAESELLSGFDPGAPKLFLSGISINHPPGSDKTRTLLPSAESPVSVYFDPDERHVSFRADLLSYRFPENSQINYRINDSEWEVAAGGEFSVFHPGRGVHTIEVEGADKTGNQASNRLTIQARWGLYWWQTPFFIFTCIMLLIALVAGAHQLRIRYVVKAKERLETVHAELVDSESRLRNLFEKSSDAIFVTDAEMRVLMRNPAADHLLELPDQSSESLILTKQFLKPGKLKAELKKSAVRGAMPDTEFKIKTAAGNEVDATVAATVFQMAEGRQWQFRIRNISKQKELEESIRSAQKMEAVGTLAGGLAHDFNNLLSPIIVHSQLAVTEIESGSRNALDDAKDALCVCGQAARKAAVLVHDLLHFARKTDEGKSLVDLTVTTRNTARFLQSSIGTNIKLDLNLPERSAWTFCSPQRLEQALMNIGLNASHAIGIENGTLTFTVERVSCEIGKSGSHADPKDFWEVSITDTGCGMSEETIERIFDPFFTTKSVDKGTGLGMSMVHAFTAESGGDIDIESEIGCGTRVAVRLAVCDPPNGVEHTVDNTTNDEKVEENVGRKKPRIICVDDDKMVLSATSKILMKMGHEVTSFSDSTDALQHLRRDPDSVDIVVTDQMMPNLTGLELAGQIKELRGDLPVVLLTGYSDLLGDRKSASGCIDAIHVKPLDYDILEDTLIALGDPCRPDVKEVALSS